MAAVLGASPHILVVESISDPSSSVPIGSPGYCILIMHTVGGGTQE